MLSVIDGLGVGGAERSLAELLPGLVDSGIDPTVACLFHRTGGVESEVVAGGFDVRFLQKGALGHVPALRRLAREVEPDLIHSTLVRSSLVARVAATHPRIPVLTSLVSMPYAAERMADPHLRTSAVRAIQAVDGWTARHQVTHFHAISHAVKRSAIVNLRIPPERITVIERGRDPERLGEPSLLRRQRARASLAIPPTAEVILAVGRQEYAKGHRFLLEAMRAIATARPRAILLLAGRDGAESAHLRVMTERPPLDRVVRFLGHRADLPDVLPATDVFAFPSLWEGLGCALIEAMALRLPIVASDLESVREVVGNGRAASLVPPRHPSALATAIGDLLDDPARARSLATAGREIFLQRFTLERSTERMVDLCRRVATGRTREVLGGGVEVT